MKDIPIAALGRKKSGKTCFLCGMFDIMESGVDGCTLSTPDLALGLYLNELFETLCQEQGDKRWPPGTGESKKFLFDFNIGLRKIMGLQWLDYRGGALEEDASEAYVKELLQHLRESFAILICIDGEQLYHLIARTEGTDQRKLLKDLGVGKVNQFLRQILPKDEQDSHLPTICLLVTKGDYLMEVDEIAVKEKIAELYGVFFGPSIGWEVGIVAVSLGEHLKKDRGSGVIAPIAVHVPLLFVVLRWYERTLAKLKEEANVTRISRDTLAAQKPGFWEWWNGDGGRGKAIRSKDESLAEAQATITSLAKTAQLLRARLAKEKIAFFRNGNEDENWLKAQ